MEIQNGPTDGQHGAVLTPFEEAAIQAIAQRIGLQINQEIVSAFSEMGTRMQRPRSRRLPGP